MREEMLSRPRLAAAVFIGGMEGIFDEFQLFRQYHADSPILALGSPGGASRELALQLGLNDLPSTTSVNFARIFQEWLPPTDR
jgi:hypothetical protein